MKKIVWLGFAYCLFGLCTLPAGSDVVVSNPGDMVRLPCGLRGDGDSVEWRQGMNMVIRVDSSGMTRKGKMDISSRAKVREMTLEIQSVKETDAGMFTCSANRKTENHLLILTTVSASPSAALQPGSDAELQCKVEGLKEEVAVQWTKPDGRLHAGSRVALEPVARSHAGTWECKFSHGSQSYSRTLVISVSEPVTPRRDREQTPCQDCATGSLPVSVPPPLPLLLGLSWWLWVVIGVGCLVVAVLMGFVICLWKRIQRKKRKLKRRENSRNLLTAKQYCQCNRLTAAPKRQQRRLREKPSAPTLQTLLTQ